MTPSAVFDDLPVPHLHLALEVEIPSDVRYIERVIELVAGQARTMDFAPRQIALNLQVALAEALSNAILRGNQEHPDKHVLVRADLDRERLVIEVADQGTGFDLQQCLADPTTPENLLREQGRGLFLMMRLMDRIERFENGGNVVRLTMLRHD